MNQAKTNCSDSSIELFLEGSMTSEQQQLFEAHLSHCLSCQGRLKTAAASDHWWDDTHDYLHKADRDTEIQEALSFLNPTDNPRMLGRFGGYEIAGIIGQGGMGVVLKGYDESLNRYSALKVLAPQLATRGSARSRFAREAQAAAAVVHDNVIAIHGVSEAAGLPFLAMPYVRGESLQKRIDRDGPMNPTEVVRVAFQIASGLAAAHAQGLVHRDIKPANILLPEGVQRVLITDFGLARAVDDSNLTGTGTIAGTPQFMSPEQARGEAVDARSDLFSLGSAMYAMCTGRNCFRAENPFGVLRRLIEDTPRPIRESNPEIPIWLAAVVSKLQEKSRADRYQSAEELAGLLEQCLAHLQDGQTPLPPELQQLALSSRRPRKIVTLAATGMLALAGVLAAANWLPMMSSSNEPQEGKPVVQKTRDHAPKTKGLKAALPNKAMTKSLQDHDQDVPDSQDPATLRQKERLLQLSNRIESLRKEGNFLEAKELELKLLISLKEADPDHGRAAALRRKMIQQRLDNQHTEADKLSKDILEIERKLHARYQEIDMIRDLQQRSKSLFTLKRQLSSLDFKNDQEKILSLQIEIERQTGMLETNYLATQARMAKLSKKETVPLTNIRSSDKSDNTELYVLRLLEQIEIAKANLDDAVAASTQSEQLVKKGFITERKATLDKSRVKQRDLQLKQKYTLLHQLLELKPVEVTKILKRENQGSSPLLKLPTKTPANHQIKQRPNVSAKGNGFDDGLVKPKGKSNQEYALILLEKIAKLEAKQASDSISRAHNVKLAKKGYVTPDQLKSDEAKKKVTDLQMKQLHLRLLKLIKVDPQRAGQTVLEEDHELFLKLTEGK